MRIFLDSSAIIDFLKGDKKAIDAIQNATDVYTSALCAYEILLGEAYAESKGRPGHYSRARRFFDSISTLPFTSTDALCAAGIVSALLRKGKRVSEMDSLIASQALLTNAIIVTRDAHFDTIKTETGQQLIKL